MFWDVFEFDEIHTIWYIGENDSLLVWLADIKILKMRIREQNILTKREKQWKHVGISKQTNINAVWWKVWIGNVSLKHHSYWNTMAIKSVFWCVHNNKHDWAGLQRSNKRVQCLLDVLIWFDQGIILEAIQVFDHARLRNDMSSDMSSRTPIHQGIPYPCISKHSSFDLALRIDDQ